MILDLFGFLGVGHSKLTKVLTTIVLTAPEVPVKYIRLEAWEVGYSTKFDSTVRETCKVLMMLLEEADFNCEYTKVVLKETVKVNKYSRLVILQDLLDEIRGGYVG